MKTNELETSLSELESTFYFMVHLWVMLVCSPMDTPVGRFYQPPAVTRLTVHSVSDLGRFVSDLVICILWLMFLMTLLWRSPPYSTSRKTDRPCWKNLQFQLYLYTILVMAHSGQESMGQETLTAQKSYYPPSNHHASHF